MRARRRLTRRGGRLPRWFAYGSGIVYFRGVNVGMEERTERMGMAQLARTRQEVVPRRDPSGEASAAMTGSIMVGGELTRWGEGISDERASQVWRRARRRWASATERLLARHFEREAVDEFTRVLANQGGASWEDRVRAETGATAIGVELLGVLLGTLRD